MIPMSPPMPRARIVRRDEVEMDPSLASSMPMDEPRPEAYNMVCKVIGCQLRLSPSTTSIVRTDEL